MFIPEDPISELDSKATTEDIIAKINEIIALINIMFRPQDGT